MEWLIWVVALIIFVLLVLVEGIGFGPNELSQVELERRADKHDATAKAELAKRKLLPLYYGLQRLKVTFLVVALVGVLAAVYPLWLALVASLGLLLLVGLAVAGGWFSWLVKFVRPLYERHIWKIVKAGEPVFKLFAPRINGGGEITFASKEELRRMIEQDALLLGADEKARLVAAMHFNDKTIGDVMVPADKVATVNQSETVGPLLLDKLHKTGHNIVVATTGKGLEVVKGLLYMSDLVPLDPEIQTVKDALRPKVFYVPADAPLATVLAASLQTGRQLFLVAKGGKTVGLITLADTVEHLLGGRIATEAQVATKAEGLE